MWHAQGADDRNPACATTPSSEEAFHPSMPGGWLATHTYGGGTRYVAGHTHYPNTTEPHQLCGDEARFGGTGAAESFWRFKPNFAFASQYVCTFDQYGPPDTNVPDGWYYGLPWRTERNGAPRDIYLKLDTIDYEALLYQHVPELRYDDDERFYPMAPSSITDFYDGSGGMDGSNALKGSDDDPEQIAVANPNLVPPLGSFAADQLSLDYLRPSYPSGGVSPRGGTQALDSDFLSERGNHSDTAADDARVVQNDPSGDYFGKLYGHVATDSQDRTWLQYFRF